MKIFGRSFVFPVLIFRTNTIYGSGADLTIRFDKGGSGGSMGRVTSWTLEIQTKKNKWQWTFCWRPQITKYYWNEKRSGQ